MMLRRRDKRRYLALAIDKNQLLDMFPDHNIQTQRYTKKSNHDDKIIYEPKKGSYESQSRFLSKIIRRRYSDLFGFIALEKSGIQILTGKKIKFDAVFILKCHLESLDQILFTLATCNRPVITTLKMSGTIRKLISDLSFIIPIFIDT